jgi:signal transduction histidine kinase/DNA-binding NarL/FixJ family response regulator
MLAGVVALALFSMLTFTLYFSYHNAVGQEKVRIALLARLIADNAAQTLSQNHEQLTRLARRPAIKAMDPANCDPILAQFHDLFPDFANLATIDLSGQAPCSGVAQPGGKPVSVAHTEWFKRALTEKRFIAGNPFTGPITGKRVSVLIEPVWNESRKLLGFIGLPLDLERFKLHIPNESLLDGTRFGLLAGDGTLVWINIEPKKMANKHGDIYPESYLPPQIEDGQFENTGADGIPRYIAIASIAKANWRAFMTVPSQSITRKVMKSALQNAIVGITSLFLIFILLVFILRRIDRIEHDLLEARDAAEKANRAKSIFLANMSHELRTPLNAILGFAELMERDVSVPEDQRRNLNVINRSGHHLLSLINDILEISKIEAGRMTVQLQVCDLHETVESVVETMMLRAHNDGLTLELHKSVSFPAFARIDVGKLRQILINLLSNAIKYTPHGSIELDVGSYPLEQGYVMLEFKVSDTGQGVASDELENIFLPFYQSENGVKYSEGTGLGLSIARQFARLLGGDLTATSLLGKGSVFSLRLPVEIINEMQPVAVQRRVLGLAAGQSTRKILIVEDKPDNMRLLSQLMTGAGFKVAHASNGQEAIERFLQWHPDFIWMDMRMPVMDGYEATRRIRAYPLGATIPIVALTASAFEEDRQAILAAGCNDMLKKPLVADYLFEIMGRLLALDFVFADEPNAVPTNSSIIDLSVLSKALRQRLHNAAAALDIEAVRLIAHDISSDYPILAQSIRREVDQYRFEAFLARDAGNVDGNAS